MNEQRVICKDCCDNIDVIYKFRQQCLASKSVLLDYILNVQNRSRDEMIFIKSECDIEDNEKIVEQINYFNDKDMIHLRDVNYKDIVFKETDTKIENGNASYKENVSASHDFTIVNVEKLVHKTEASTSVTAINNQHGINIMYKKYPCKNCGKRFFFLSQLEAHMTNHTAQKLISCHICNMKFKKTSYLTKHMRRHTGEKPYECSVCNKKFSNPSNLTRHMVLHTKERPYQCTICYKKFNQTSNLNVHMQTHTVDKAFTMHLQKQAAGVRIECDNPGSFLRRRLAVEKGSVPESW